MSPGPPRLRAGRSRIDDAVLLLVDHAADHEGADDLEQALDDEPDPRQYREHGDRIGRERRDDDSADQADDPEENPPAVALTARKAGRQRGQTLDDPADAD